MNLKRELRYFVHSLLKRPDKSKKLNSDPLRKDVYNIYITDISSLNVYWKVLKIGKGPAAIFKVYDTELLKFDCFGKDKGHYHLSPDYSRRIFFKEDSALEQINKASLELKNNLHKFLGMQKNEKIRNIEIPFENLENALHIMREKMINYLETVPELKCI